MDQITKIEIYQKNIPLIAPFIISLEKIENATNVFIKIETANGLVDWGECSPFPTILGETQASSFSVAQYIAPHLLGRSVHNLHNNLTILDQVISHCPCTKSGFDMALYDLAAQQAGLPLYAFLGGTAPKQLTTDMTIGLDEPTVMARAAKALKIAGFDTIKIKLGRGFPEDVERIQQVRQTIGNDIALRVDANQGWNVPTALQVLNGIAPLGVQWCEAPIAHWNLKGMAQLQQQSPIPIMADESLFSPQDALKHIEQNCCNYFNIKLAKSGGIGKAIQIVHLAEAAGVALQVGCFSESRLGITALAHFVAAYPAIQFYDMDSPLMHQEDPVEGGVIIHQNGSIDFGAAQIGLGAKISEKWLADAEKVVI